ncbi:MAG: thiamine pyrophosphate-dependent enzyme [Thermoplasmata archaeon]
MRLKLKDLPEEDVFSSGHTACAGCGAAMAIRNIAKVLGKDIVVYVPPSCLSVFNGLFPSCAWTVPYHHTVFENTGAAISGLSRAMKRKGLHHVTVVGIAGDGGTADIGLQALSGAAERNEDVIYICYDNEAYMNTGVQRSGSTPHGASTTTTPVGEVIKGNQDFKKDVPLIMMAHGVPYVATASGSFPLDLINKVRRAKEMKGFRYIQVYSPCVPGWRYEQSKTVELGKLAVKCGMWMLMECVNGRLTINREPKMRDLGKYLKMQGRFRHMDDRQIAELRESLEKKWMFYKGYAELTQQLIGVSENSA